MVDVLREDVVLTASCDRIVTSASYSRLSYLRFLKFRTLQADEGIYALLKSIGRPWATQQ